MLRRVISAVIGIPVFVLLVLVAESFFVIAVFILLLLGCAEFFRMARQKGYRPLVLWGYIYLLATVILTARGHILVSGEISILFILLCSIAMLFSFPKTNTMDVAWTVIGTLYIVGLGKYFIALRLIDPKAVFISFIMAWSFDTFAYFAGSKFGNIRPFKKLSPKKSLEGLIGGIAGCSIITLIFAAWWDWPLLPMIILAFLSSLMGQGGDLIESAFKRYFGVKDSGNVMPGHGGVLDRFDGALVVAPLAYYFLTYFVL